MHRALQVTPLRGALFAAVILAASTASAQPRRAAAPARADSTVFSRSQTVARLGFPNGLSLDGSFAERTVAFRLPGTAPIDSARLDLTLRFSPGALPQSNVQVFVNDQRRATVLRSAADSSGVARVRIPLDGSSLPRDYANVRLRSSIGVTTDRCLDQHVAATFAEIDPATRFTYYTAASALADIRQVWAALPETTAIALPARSLSEDEFRTALAVSIAAEREGHRVRYVRLPALGDVIVAPGAELDSAAGFTDRPADANIGVFHYVGATGAAAGIYVDPRRGPVAAAMLGAPWARLAAAPSLDVRASAKPDSLPNELSFANLGISNLQQDMGVEAVWRIPLDLRDLPPGRVPSRLHLQVASAPNTFDRQIVVFVFLNGTVVQSADLTASGAPQMIDARLPSALITTRNELRVVIQRRFLTADLCSKDEAAIPAQILPTSSVVTTAANANARVFSAVAARLTETSPLYLPRAALDEPSEYLARVAKFGRAMWSASRAPRAVFYDGAAPAAPTEAFVVIGKIPGVDLAGPVTTDSGRFRLRRKEGGQTLIDVSDLRAWTIAQVVRWGDQTGVQLIASAAPRLVPDWADAYGATTLTLANADSTVFSINTADQKDALIFNDGPTLLERLRADLVLWILFGILLLAPLVYLTVRAVIRRTPRRRLPPRVERRGTRSSQVGPKSP